MSFKDYYLNTIKPNICNELAIKNVHKSPKINKIIINRGLGIEGQTTKTLEAFKHELKLITGQDPKINISKKSIASFKLREKTPVGISVTLRDKKMYDFLERLVHLALPRIRDFNGISGKSFDQDGNYTFGLSEQLIFPEIDYEIANKLGMQGMDITLVTNTKNCVHSKSLLTHFGLPFK